MPKSAVRQTNSNESNAVGRALFRRVNIADIRPVVDTSLAVDSLPNTEVAIARDVEPARRPKAVLKLPTVLLLRAPAPSAVLF